MKSIHGKADLLVGNVQDQRGLGFPNRIELVTRLAMKCILPFRFKNINTYRKAIENQRQEN